MAALEAAGEAGTPVTLLSPPEFAAYGGAGFFNAIVRRARAKAPTAKSEAVLDCGNAPGLVLGALRAGAEAVRFGGRSSVRKKIAAIAAAHGARLLTVRPRALDLLDAADARTACHAWLVAKPRAQLKNAPVSAIQDRSFPSRTIARKTVR
ncbi:MAG: hypothetical protein ACYC1L_14625 [Alphaproteobacteria bacterium]